MTELLLGETEALEAIAQDTMTRDLFLRMATMSAHGTLGPFLRELLADADADADAEIAGILAELASDRAFLHAVEDYVQCTHVLH